MQVILVAVDLWLRDSLMAAKSHLTIGRRHRAMRIEICTLTRVEKQGLIRARMVISRVAYPALYPVSLPLQNIQSYHSINSLILQLRLLKKALPLANAKQDH
jgi:hypothetical protein